ncbi:MAG: hypothetical protein ACHQD7_04415 [Chitinophagales bacterium]
MKIRLLFILFGTMFTFGCLAAGISDKVSCTEFDDYVLTDVLTPFGPIPTAL